MGKEEREKEKMESFSDRVLMCKSVKTHLHVEEHNIEKKQNLEVKHSISSYYLRSIKSKCTRSSMPNFFNVSTWGVIVQGVCLKERLWIPYMCEY